MPITQNDDDITNALNIARADIGNGNAIQAKVGGLNQALTGLDLEANTPQFNTGIGGAGMPIAAMAALPRRSGSLEEAVARAEARSRGEIPQNPASSVSQSDLGSLGPNPAANLSVGMGHNRPVTTTTLQELADLAGMTPREYGTRFSKVLSKTPYEEWSYTHQPYRDMQERKIFDPQSMKSGDVIIPFFGDLTSAGQRITNINSNRLHFPTDTEGGESYMRMTPDIWASGQSIVSGLANKAEAGIEASKKLGYENPDVYGFHVGMGPQSGDFSIHTAKAILGMLDPSRISASDAQKFNDFMKAQQISSKGKEVYKPFEDFPGLYSDDLHDYLMKQGQGDARIKFSKGMDTADLLKRGFPDVGAARFATTEPLLGGLPTYSTGMSIGKLNMDNPVSKSPVMPVGSYPVSMPGSYEGGFEAPVYKDLVFRDFANAYNLRTPNATAPAKYKAYAGNKAYQIVDPELKDSLSEAMELAKRGRSDGGEVNEDIAHALRLATGGRAHFDDGGDVRGGDNPGGLSGDTGRYATGDVGESQGEVNAAIAGALDAQQSLRSGESFDSNAPATPSKSIQEATSLAPALPLTAGVDPADTAMAKQVLSQQRQDAFSAAQAQANAAENRAQGMAFATAPSIGSTTFGAENGIIPVGSFVPLGSAPGTVSASEVAAPAPTPLTASVASPAPLQPAFNPYAQGQMPQPSGAELRTPSQDAVVANALVKAATFEPSQNAALRAARDAITQNMGQPDITVPRTTGSGSVPPADLPAAKAAPQATTTANETPRIPVDSLEDPALIAAYNAQYGLSGPKNTMADMALGQRLPNITTNNPLINTVQGANNFLTNLFTPSYNLGSDQYNKISQNPEPEPMTTFGGHGGGQQQVQAAPVTEAAAAAPVAAPVVPGTPVPYTYAKRMPYLDYGAYGAGIGNISPISYADPINWSLVPGYRASGGRVGENNALANVLRMLAQNRS